MKKLINLLLMGFWGVIYGVRKLFSPKFRQQQKAKAHVGEHVLKGEHAMMLVAARHGDVRAQYHLGVGYAEGTDELEQDYGEAAHWFREAAKQGDPNACYSLGICFANGQGVAQEPEEAFKWLRAAAEQEHPSAQVSLGVCIQKGIGVWAN